jgi:hypothetical protein
MQNVMPMIPCTVISIEEVKYQSIQVKPRITDAGVASISSPVHPIPIVRLVADAYNSYMSE